MIQAVTQTNDRESDQTAVLAAAPGAFIFRENLAYRRLRRTFDIAGAAGLLAIAAPVLCAAAIGIVLEDGWPIVFCQRRVGRFGRLFTIYKLRTMRKNQCADGLSPTSGRDARITRVGYWLRRLSIDELPQLINIIRGEMALVGPRPEMPFLVRNYQHWQHLRHIVTPGITGLWQIKCRSTVPLHLPQATLLDLEYIRRASHLTDFRLLVQTFVSLVSTKGAY